MQVAEAALVVYERLGQLESISGAAMISDLRVGRLMAAAAVRGALENVSINLDSLTDAAYTTQMKAKSTELEARLAGSPVTAD
jgi:formiminotetrahydrofolate cyclodeaminase